MVLGGVFAVNIEGDRLEQILYVLVKGWSKKYSATNIVHLRPKS